MGNFYYISYMREAFLEPSNKRPPPVSDDELEREPLEALPAAKEPPKPKPPLSNLPDVKVLCRNIEGVFRPRDNMIYCVCTRCERESKAAAAGEAR